MRHFNYPSIIVHCMLLISSAWFLSCGKESRHNIENDVTLKFNSTWNVNEKFVLDNQEDIVYNAIPWGGLVGTFLDRNMPADLSDFESITFRFAQPLPVPVQVVVANRFKTVGKKGITSLTCSFDGQDVTSVNEIVLQPHDSANIIVKDVYLNPGNALWESKVIWRKGCNFGNWENGFVIKPEFFATAYEGDKIEFIFNADTSNPDITYWLLKTVYNTTPNTLEGNDSELNDYGCASVSSQATAYRILLTANDVENLQHYGLFTNGFSVYVKQVNLLRRVYSEE